MSRSTHASQLIARQQHSLRVAVPGVSPLYAASSFQWFIAAPRRLRTQTRFLPGFDPCQQRSPFSTAVSFGCSPPGIAHEPGKLNSSGSPCIGVWLVAAGLELVEAPIVGVGVPRDLASAVPATAARAFRGRACEPVGFDDCSQRDPRDPLAGHLVELVDDGAPSSLMPRRGCQRRAGSGCGVLRRRDG